MLKPRPKLQDKDQDRGRSDSETGLVIRSDSTKPSFLQHNPTQYCTLLLHWFSIFSYVCNIWVNSTQVYWQTVAGWLKETQYIKTNQMIKVN